MDKKSATLLVEKYIAMWNETDRELRRALVAEVFTPEGTYTDPVADAAGHAAVDAYLASAQQNFRGMSFTFGTVLAHHDAVHFTWRVGPADGAPVASGSDVAWVAEDGRIGRLYGFFDGF
ncbi:MULTISPECIES: nuclear transport factor 2 family protein [unclassified Streptomyces]|uniref:nuclear transport factor 2 family protein n=1 Tax=unclassified Streptomyces TaxID=2593676 RepID=UPI0033320B6A